MRQFSCGFATPLLGLTLLACSSAPPQSDTPQAYRSSEPAAAKASAPESEPAGAEATAAAPAELPPPCDPISVDAGELQDMLQAPVPALVDHGPANLAPFWEKLAALERGERKQPVRIFFYGDSNLALDQVSGELRRRLQKRFGDGGHGYMGVGMPARGYRHMDVRRIMVGHWKTKIYSHHNPEGNGFGAGGMLAQTSSKHSRAILKTAKEGAPVGRTATHFGVFYVAKPDGGRFEMQVDKKPVKTVDAVADQEQTEYAVIETDDAAHEFRLQSKLDKKDLRILGVTLERANEPSIVVDAYGLTGSTYHHLARMDNAIDRRMLELRKPDLVMFLIGTNYHRFDKNPVSAGKVLSILRDIDPQMPIVMMTPPDRIKSKNSTASHPSIIKVSEQLTQIAQDSKVGFWDFRAAMGGPGSMHKFYWNGLAGKDLTHLTPAGAELMGARLDHAIVSGLAKHLGQDPQAGCKK